MDIDVDKLKETISSLRGEINGFCEEIAVTIGRDNGAEIQIIVTVDDERFIDSDNHLCIKGDL